MALCSFPVSSHRLQETVHTHSLLALSMLQGSVIRDCGDGSENVQISGGQGGDSKGINKSSQGSYSVKSSDPTDDLPIHLMPSKEDRVLHY